MTIRSKQIPSRIISGSCLFVLLLGLCATAPAQQKPEQLAQQSADTWLALVDSGKYADSWQEASQLFKAHATKEQWHGP